MKRDRSAGMKLSALVFGFVILGPSSAWAETRLSELIDSTRIRCSYESERSIVLLSAYGRVLVFSPGFSLGLLDYREVVEMGETSYRNGEIWLSETADTLIRGIFAPQAGDRQRIAAIIIDPGHGGKDPGAIHTHARDGASFTVAEKDVVLAISTIIFKELARLFPDKRIILTRSSDVYLTLEERTEIANAVDLAPDEAMIFVSVHANASLNPKSNGFEVWYLPPEYRRELLDAGSVDESAKDLIPILNTMLEEEITVESIILARAISEEMGLQIGDRSVNRGLKEESWFVVRKAKMPSVLVEVGFLTNAEEARLLADPSYLQKVAKGIYNGIIAFVESFERTSGFTEQ